MENNFYHPKFIPTWILLFIMRIVAFLPLKLQKIIAKPIGFILKKLAKKKYKIATINIQKCFPKLSKQQQNKLTNEHFFDFAISLFEVANCFYKSPKSLKKSYQINNLDLLKNHINNNENIILLVGHFTTMIIAGRILADNIHFADIYRPQNNKLFDFDYEKKICNAWCEND
jgi:KDO2-lipid IV(A) lauroyltransferase